MTGTIAPPPEPADAEQILSWADFLTIVAPGKRHQVNLLVKNFGPAGWYCNTPQIKLFCNDSACEKETFWDGDEGDWVDFKKFQPVFLRYKCRHCEKSLKLFAVIVYSDIAEAKRLRGLAEKIGEMPTLNVNIPARVNKLLGEDREYFFKGLRAEKQGMGIGAFGYYRRVVESQKNRIIDEIIKVCERIKADPDIVNQLNTAKTETQFTKSVGTIKNALPEVLKVGGHNPLLLLHNALSEGLHAQTDDECLELATSIRIVMTALAERIEIALKEEAALTGAVSRLLNKPAAKPEK